MHLTPTVVHNCPKAVGVYDFCALCTKRSQISIEKRRGQPREFWSLASTIDGSTLPQDCVEEQLYAEHEVTDKTYNITYNRLICVLGLEVG